MNINTDHVTGFVVGLGAAAAGVYMYKKNQQRVDEWLRGQGINVPQGNGQTAAAMSLEELMREKEQLEDLIAELYQRMDKGRKMMPHDDMQRVTQRMIEYDWFGSYRDIDAVAEALDRVAWRIRFANDFDNAIEDLQRSHEMILQGFLEFYPQLQCYVSEQGIESD